MSRRGRGSVFRTVRLWALPVLLLLAWQVLPSISGVSTRYLPPLSEVVAYGVGAFARGELFADIVASLARVAIGAGIAVVAGTLVGLLLSRGVIVGKLFDPLMQALRLTPIVAAAPLLVLWLGFGEASKIAIIAAMGFFPMYLSAYTAFLDLDPRLREVGDSLRFSWRQSALLISVPAALPRLLDGARYAVLLGWLSLLVAELIGTEVGIGNLIMGGATFDNMPLILVATILLALLTKGSDAAFAALSRLLVPWHSSSRGTPLGSVV